MQNKANTQAMHWLYSMTNAPSFDAINAENALALINAQNRRLKALGAAFAQVRNQRDRAWKALEEAREGLLKGKEEEEREGRYFCPHCKCLVPTEMLRIDRSPLLICLRCGSEIFLNEGKEGVYYGEIDNQ